MPHKPSSKILKTICVDPKPSEDVEAYRAHEYVLCDMNDKNIYVYCIFLWLHQLWTISILYVGINAQIVNI